MFLCKWLKLEWYWWLRQCASQLAFLFWQDASEHYYTGHKIKNAEGMPIRRKKNFEKTILATFRADPATYIPVEPGCTV